ncbi:DUF6414 family protein [Exiguobacterium sp. R-17]|uniref:DUF6414 family protein n=1 Tax=Exiguobacterium sp. R-17 TaxID=3404054 RepID=UPI003CE7ECBC
MKEIIYLDTDKINSMLAQLDEGLISNFSMEMSGQETKTNSNQISKGKNSGMSANIKVDTGLFPGGSLGAGASFGNNGSENEIFTKTILEGQKDILNKAFHDYALELLIEKLETKKLFSDGEKFEEGDLYIEKSTFRFYDFNLLRDSMDLESMNKFMRSEIEDLDMSYNQAKNLLKKINLNAKEREKIDAAKLIVSTTENTQPILGIFKQINTLGTLASKLLKDLTIIKSNNMIGLLKKEYLRESTESLSFRTDHSREVKMLIQVIGKKDTIFNGYNMGTLSVNSLDLIPNMMLDILLGSFEILEVGDLLVTPIAVYYE